MIPLPASSRYHHFHFVNCPQGWTGCATEYVSVCQALAFVLVLRGILTGTWVFGSIEIWSSTWSVQTWSLMTTKVRESGHLAYKEAASAYRSSCRYR